MLIPTQWKSPVKFLVRQFINQRFLDILPPIFSVWPRYLQYHFSLGFLIRCTSPWESPHCPCFRNWRISSRNFLSPLSHEGSCIYRRPLLALYFNVFIRCENGSLILLQLSEENFSMGRVLRIFFFLYRRTAVINGDHCIIGLSAAVAGGLGLLLLSSACARNARR